MHFMFLILAFMLWAVVWGFFHSNPRGVARARLLACNVAIIALGAATRRSRPTSPSWRAARRS